MTKPQIDGDSEIAKFFEGCNVLITGGSGFVGKLLVEKILRSCSKVEKVYIIMRGKKGKSVEERFKQHFEDKVYDRLKIEQPNFATKIVLIEGGLDESGLAISPESRAKILDTHIVFHGAATVRFDDKLRFAANINVRGTKEILLLAREMPNLKAIVHIGTAFSMCIHKLIDEVFYKTPIGCDELLTLVDILDDPVLESLTPSLIDKWPNTYAFTKTVAEDVVLKYSEGLPVCIVRPSIMIPTDHEPMPGWINNLYGATGVTVGAAVGLLHSLHCNKNNIADIIPADYVINNIIAAAWDIGTNKKKTVKALTGSPDEKTGTEQEKPPIYNSVSSCQNPITWGEYMSHNEESGRDVPTIMCIWIYWFTLNKHLWVHTIYVYLTHLFPALIVDGLALLTGRKPRLLSAYKKIHKFSGVISYFSTQQWQFRNKNVLELWDKLTPIDKKFFYFNMEECNWTRYFYDHVRGLRLYLLNDPVSTIPDARKKVAKLKIAHYTVMTLSSLFFLWIMYLLLTTLFSILLNIFA